MKRPYSGVAAVLFATMWAVPLLAQSPLDVSPLVNGAEREKAYQQLFRDVAELERQSNILKAVVKLTSPAVVHIEAQRTEGSRSYGRSRTIEEAGSGVIVDI